METKTKFVPVSEMRKYIEETHQKEVEAQRVKVKEKIETNKYKGECYFDDMFEEIETELKMAGYKIDSFPGDGNDNYSYTFKIMWNKK